MSRKLMDPPPKCTFHQIYQSIRKHPDYQAIGLVTTGGVSFIAKASLTRDGREFINLPHNNRIYSGDWGYINNSMGKEGQRIGHYARPLDEWCANL